MHTKVHKNSVEGLRFSVFHFLAEIEVVFTSMIFKVQYFGKVPKTSVSEALSYDLCSHINHYVHVHMKVLALALALGM